MKFSALMGASLLSIFLTACGSTYQDELASAKYDKSTLKTTIKATSSKIPETYVACVRAQLQTHYPSASFRKKAVNLYEGNIPSTERNAPLAVYDVQSTTDEILANVTLKQTEPKDELVYDIFNSCL